MFASPVKLGSLPISYSWYERQLGEAAARANIGRIGTHTMRHTYRAWLDAVGTPIAVQQSMMRHTDIRTTMNIYGDCVTDEMSEAHSKVVGLALNGAQAERNQVKRLKSWRRERDSIRPFQLS